MIKFDLTRNYNRDNFKIFLRNFLPDDSEFNTTPIYFETEKSNFNACCTLGTCESLNLIVFEIKIKSNKDPRTTLTKEAVELMRSKSFYSNALVIFYSENSNQWRLSLITTDFEIINGKVKPLYSNPKRFSFKLGEDCKKHTPESMLFDKGKVQDLDDLKNRFALDVVTQQFYNDLFSWYEWATKNVTFPKGDTRKDKNNNYNVVQSNENNELNLIRLITRMIFVWFIKQKELIPNWIFDKEELNKILVKFNPKSKTEGNYYNAIIQNLFFATLNKSINERKFADNSDSHPNEHFGVKTFYRDNIKDSFFNITQQEIINRFKCVPFLNGGLFECLDKLIDNQDTNSKTINIESFMDGFSRNPDWMAFVPNCLFWNSETEKNEGLISILNRYNFTVEENTPTDIQVALDPELLGKVFENLLGTYNPETRETARKDSGSFYTPRNIVDFMITEALKDYIGKRVPLTNNELDLLFKDDIENYESDFNENIIECLKKIRIIDPACGSGAFPMGALHKILNLIKKCDNKIHSEKEIYKLKLELIENCLYGVDIQPIAVQICKLRFFISLICEQEKTDDVEQNYGFNPLPNLETKFVAANSLVGINKDNGYLETNDITEVKKELQEIRHKHFNAQTASEKAEYRKLDKEKRNKLIDLLQNGISFSAENSQQLATWNPYDQNQVSSFLDPEWMFNIKKGFDIVIGNPPYISTKDVKAKDKKIYEKEFGFSDDTYNLFTFKGLELTKNKGTLTYIIPKTFWTTQTKRNMRDLILSKNIKYIFDTANPFESVMVDTCIIQIENSQFNKNNEVIFLDGSNNLKSPSSFPPIKQDVYLNTQNSVIFKPTDFNLKVWSKYGKIVKDLYNQWWDKISTSKNIEKNKLALETYRASLKPGDIALLGCLTEGGQGLATANNGKYIAVKKSSKWASHIVESRPLKLEKAIKENKKIQKELGNITPKEYLNNLSEDEIASLFDDLKTKYGRDIFGQGYIYKIIDDDKIANVDLLTDDEKENGIDSTKAFYVPYDKGDKDGNRWYLDTPFAIAWSKENVQFFKTNSGKKGTGMPVMRNIKFYFKEGFCWTDINSTYLKARIKNNGIFDVVSMSLFTKTEIPDWYFVTLINTMFVSLYVDNFINNTSHFQINDARQLPIKIPTTGDLRKLKSLFWNSVEIKQKQFNSEYTPTEAESLLYPIQEKIDALINQLYEI